MLTLFLAQHEIPILINKSDKGIAAKMLYLVGLGLSDETDITVRGLEVVRKCKRVYLEAYTSILLVDKDVLVSAQCLACCRANTDS